MPYILASLHPIIHNSCFATIFLMHFAYKHSDVKISDDWDLNRETFCAALIMICVHAFCSVIHYLIEWLKINDFEKQESS